MVVAAVTLPAGQAMALDPSTSPPQSEDLRKELAAYPHRIVFESFRDGSWDLWIMDADGTDRAKLTDTDDVDEMYPKASPDGSTICFVADEGRGKDKVRCVYLMNADGSGRKLVARKARWPCWGPDGQTIAYLKCRPGPYTSDHAGTKGMVFYDLQSGKHTPHANDGIERMLCPTWSPDDRWMSATVGGGMGYGFAIIAFEVRGKGHHLLLPSKKGAWQCRPDFDRTGTRLAWAEATGTGPKDKVFGIGVADVTFEDGKPALANRSQVVTARWPTELYHADWSPDGRYMVYSRGPREMSRMKPQRAIISIKAPGWNICVADTKHKDSWVVLTTDGLSNKEPDWVFVKEP